MRSVAGVVLLVLLAGCAGVGGQSTPDSSATELTPAPVPDDGAPPGEPTPGARGVDVPGVGEDRVEAVRLLGIAHASSLDVRRRGTVDNYERETDWNLTVGGEPHLEYHERLVAGNGGIYRVRTANGPGTGRLVGAPPNGSVESVREVWYGDGNGSGRLRTTNGERVDNAAEPAIVSHPVTDANTVLAIGALDGARVEPHEGDPGRIRLVADGPVGDGLVPEYLERPRNVTATATVTASGRIETFRLTYEATFEGRPARVEHVVRYENTAFTSPPEWYEG